MLLWTVTRFNESAALLHFLPQVVSNPLLMHDCAYSAAAFEALSQIDTAFIRYVPWFPYPWYAVAELAPPTAAATSWNFTFADSMLADFMTATANRSSIINFSTQPTWLYTTDWSYPADPSAVC